MGYNIHLDNPQRIRKWRESLSPRELEIFNQGQLYSLASLLAQIRKTKINLLNKQMDLVEEEVHESKIKYLESKITLLDVYDSHYTRKLEHMSERFPVPTALLTSMSSE